MQLENKGYICMVVDNSYPNDLRVRKEAESLAQSGFKVMVVCPRTNLALQKEVVNKVLVIRIGTNYTNFKKGIHDIIESACNINIFFYTNLKKILTEYKVDCLHIHDLPLASTGYRLKNLISGSILLDLHENFPEAVKTWFQWKRNFLIKFKNRLFFNSASWEEKEKKFCGRYDKVICVVEEMKNKLLSKYKLKEDKLVVISNTESSSFVKNFNNGLKQHVIDKNSFSITYVGGFGPHRGLDDSIIGIEKIVKKIPHAKLYLVGRGSFDVEMKLKELVKRHKVENNVVFVGYRPFEEVSAIMMQSDINIIPHKADDHTNNTIPHKLFQIMMSGSLLLVSSCRPLKRIVEKYDAGIIFEAENPVDFADKVCFINENYKSLDDKIKNALDAVQNGGLNWEEESIKLINFYRDICP